MVSAHHWADLGTEADRQARAAFRERAARRWALWSETGALSLGFGEGVWVERQNAQWAVRWQEPSCRPFAESVARAAPSGAPVVLGLQGRGWNAARDWVERTQGVNLATAELRVGLTRGHLLAIVVTIPLDVPGPPDRLQSTAEAFCEYALGERTLDRWVVSIDVVRSARRSKLAVLSDSRGSAAETHPLALVEQLLSTGIDAVRAGLPDSQLSSEVALEEWTALELAPTGPGLQAERLQAFTRVPEALKAALEGLPFDSARFTRGPEVMIWLSWSSGSLPDRIRAREAAEAIITELGARERVCSLCGSGFGRSRDYLDLWVLPEAAVLADLLARLTRTVGPSVELGFYDSHWSRERLGP